MNAIADIELSFNVAVNQTQTLPQMIEAGQYAFAHPEITTQHFPEQLDGTVRLEVVLVHFNKYTKTEEVLKLLSAMGLRPATLVELLSLGKAYPKAQRSLPILALGSVWQPESGGRLIPGLGGWNERELLLYLFENGGSSSCRFAAVRKCQCSIPAEV